MILLEKPDILIIDETIAVGDFRFREKCFDLIRSLNENGTTILLVSHNIEHIRKLCARVLWLDKGKLIMDGDTETVCGAYMSGDKPDSAPREREERVSAKKKAVYTAVFGDYDKLKDKNIRSPGWDYYCFTDNKTLKSDFWKIIYIDEDYIKRNNLDNRNPLRTAKFFKLHPETVLPGYDESIWIDGSVSVTGDIDQWIETYSTGKDFLLFEHPDRACAYEEGNYCVKIGFADKEVVKRQLTKYENEGLPKDAGLFMLSVIYRKHTPAAKSLGDLWDGEIRGYAARDQISFTYCLHKLNISVDTCPLNIKNNIYFYRLKKHKGEIQF